MADDAMSQDELTKSLDNVAEPQYCMQLTHEQRGRVPEDWETAKFRSKATERIQAEIMKTASLVPKSGAYLEAFVFSRAKSRKEYLDLVAGVVIYVAEFNHKRSKTTDKEDIGKTNNS